MSADVASKILFLVQLALGYYVCISKDRWSYIINVTFLKIWLKSCIQAFFFVNTFSYHSDKCETFLGLIQSASSLHQLRIDITKEYFRVICIYNSRRIHDFRIHKCANVAKKVVLIGLCSNHFMNLLEISHRLCLYCYPFFLWYSC
jgi:hypothetical protein